MKSTNSNIKYIYILAMLFFGVKSIAQKAVLDTNQIEIGDQVNLRLQVDLTNNNTIVFPDFEENIIEGIEILETFPSDTINSGKTLEKRYLLTSFEDSAFYIEPFEILVNNDTIKTNFLMLHVGYPDVDSAFVSEIDTTQLIKIRDIKKPIQTPWTFKEFWSEWGNLILIIFFSLLVIAAGIYYLIRRKKNKPIFAAPKPKIPPHITAKENLEKLNEKKLCKKGKVKKHYTELTEIVRVYIEDRFNIPAMEYISYQIIAALSIGKKIDEETISKLQSLLTTADMVKFAKALPLEHENDLCMKNAYFFVEKTTAVEKPEEPKKNEDENKDIFDNEVIDENKNSKLSDE